MPVTPAPRDQYLLLAFVQFIWTHTQFSFLNTYKNKSLKREVEGQPG